MVEFGALRFGMVESCRMEIHGPGNTSAQKTFNNGHELLLLNQNLNAHPSMP